MKIEEKYTSPSGFSEVPLQPSSSNASGSNYFPTNMVNYLNVNIGSNDRYASKKKDKKKENKVAKGTVVSGQSQVQKVADKPTKRIGGSKPPKKSMKIRNGENRRNHCYLNSWEQGGGAQEDDNIEEELSHYESAYENKVSGDEGSAARRLLDSMSKMAADNKTNEEDSSEDEIHRLSLAQFNIIRESSKEGGSRFGSRPFSPPFSQFSKK
mmetsp:Transcript_19267/g.22342  ORF Transcript_19267/g.22342 Transcript_19267/m.22342 type:complete len:211 (-) Transcript_19267:24-656(-)